eukprot:snap_masked-scaffold_78-processed-gene-0.50-mRNA-1 protein AED:0.45 eAED:0.45 QI:0/-1/0/1/-1/1/1/0/295
MFNLSFIQNQVLSKHLTKRTQKYKLHKKIGKGANGKVYTAHLTTPSPHAPQILACKIQDVSQPKRRSKVQKEIDLLATLNHPNISRYYFSETFANVSKIYLEFCPYGELFGYLKMKGPLSENVTRNILVQIISVLLYLDDMNIIHRDLKLENILLSDVSETSTQCNIEIKVIDFGLATRVTEDSQRCVTVCGSSYYVAPEVVLVKRKKQTGYGKEVDIWGCGVILYMLLSNMPPFYDATGFSVYDMIVKGRFSFEHDIWGSISVEGKDLVKRMLTKRVSDRIRAEEAVNHNWFVQ